jgi:hypothetical protein
VAVVLMPLSTNCVPVALGLGLGLGLAAGDGVAVAEAAGVDGPHANADAATSISRAIARLTIQASLGHRSRALPVQVTGRDLDFCPLLHASYARRHIGLPSRRHTKYASASSSSTGPIAPRPVMM